jgi:hypothetical protein
MNSTGTLTANGDEFLQNPGQQGRTLPQIDADREIVGDSPSMREIRTYLSKVALTDSTVLITGETGTGKELLASLIHRKSPRHRKPFICVNCAAMPESLIESEMFGYEKGAFTGAVGYRRGKFEQALLLRQRFCEVLKAKRSIRWEGKAPFLWTSGLLRQPTRIRKSSWRKENSGKTSITVSMWLGSTCRRCVKEKKTFPVWSHTLLRK